MGIQSVLNGWTCDCGINRNASTETWRDCVCNKPHTAEEVKASNEAYWKRFWNVQEFTDSRKRIMAIYQQAFGEENNYEYPDYFITFEADGMNIVNPFISSCSRFEVDPVKEYGDAYLNSGWFEGRQLQKLESHILQIN